MRSALLIGLLTLLSACAAPVVTDATQVTTQHPLNESIAIPTKLKVVWYADHSELSKVVRTRDSYYYWNQRVGKSFSEALELIVPSLFADAEAITAESDFHYLFKFSSKPSFGNGLSTYSIDLTLDVLDTNGQVIRSFNAIGVQRGAGGGDGNAFKAAYAKAIKDTLHQFLNSLGAGSIQQQASAAPANHFAKVEEKLELTPASTGTGFFINGSGQLLTANHVVENCVKLAVQREGEDTDSYIVASSKLLDIAALKTPLAPSAVASLPAGTSLKDRLGSPVFVTGFPLSDILAPYPSLTIGNISSVGGLKGASGYFQYSAPTQPGNSGGPIVDYSGQTVGMVTSSLNQRMMLEKAGTTSQNINFGLSTGLLTQFLSNHSLRYTQYNTAQGFEPASKQAVKYTTQVVCYK